MFLNAIQPDDPGLGGGFFKKAFRHDPLRRVLSRGLKRDPLLKAIKRSDMSVKRYVSGHKWAQGVLYAGGAVLAPFTGGLSLAAAAAAVQSSKAAAKGRSFGRQFAQGVGAGAVGWVAGVGLVYAAGSVGVGSAATAGQSASILVPFGTAAAPVAGGVATAASGYGVAAGAVGAPVATAATATASAGWLSTFGQTALMGMTLARTLAGAKQATAGGDPNGPLPAGAYPGAPSNYGYGGGSGASDSGGGGGGGAPAGTDPLSPAGEAQSVSTLQTLQPYLPYAAAGLGVILLLSISRRKRR